MEIAPCPPELQRAALLLLYAEAADAPARVDATLRQAMLGQVDLSGLCTLVDAGELHGAVWASLEVGRAAGIIGPKLTPAATASTQSAVHCQRLLAAAVEHARRQGAVLVKGLLRDRDGEEEPWLAAGFERLATLSHLTAPAESFPFWEPKHPEFQLEPYDPAQRRRMEAIIEATFHQTLDCPALEGLRSIEDVVQGYLAIGAAGSERWQWVRHAGRDVGALVVADYPAEHRWELVYVGLVPTVRRRGWGRHLIRTLQWQAGRAARHEVFLAVDTSNTPAVKTYASCGFIEWDRRRVVIQRLV